MQTKQSKSTLKTKNQACQITLEAMALSPQGYCDVTANQRADQAKMTLGRHVATCDNGESAGIDPPGTDHYGKIEQPCTP